MTLHHKRLEQKQILVTEVQDAAAAAEPPSLLYQRVKSRERLAACLSKAGSD